MSLEGGSVLLLATTGSGTGVSGTGVGNIKTQDVSVPVQKEPYCSYSSTKYVTVLQKR